MRNTEEEQDHNGKTVRYNITVILLAGGERTLIRNPISTIL